MWVAFENRFISAYHRRIDLLWRHLVAGNHFHPGCRRPCLFNMDMLAGPIKAGLRLEARG